jgi:hypothetical protein
MTNSQQIVTLTQVTGKSADFNGEFVVNVNKENIKFRFNVYSRPNGSTGIWLGCNDNVNFEGNIFNYLACNSELLNTIAEIMESHSNGYQVWMRPNRKRNKSTGFSFLMPALSYETAKTKLIVSLIAALKDTGNNTIASAIEEALQINKIKLFS